MAREIALFVTASITMLTNQLCYCVHHVEEWLGSASAFMFPSGIRRSRGPAVSQSGGREMVVAGDSGQPRPGRWAHPRRRLVQ
jgi:hypothetical protein